jgi:RHS repeat-associated protein
MAGDDFRAPPAIAAWLGDIPVATLQPNGSGGVNVFYVHTDHLNSPRKVAQPSTGTLVWRWDADPLGTAVPNQNPAGLGTFTYNLRFPGQYYETETGINYNWTRDYDSLTGRYIESDSIGLWGGLNTYGYAGNNPTNNFDASGRQSAAVPLAEACPVCAAAVVVIGGLYLIVKSCSDDKPAPAPMPGRVAKCREAFKSCLGSFSIPEAKCFEAYDTCVKTTGPMIFPGFGVVN